MILQAKFIIHDTLIINSQAIDEYTKKIANAVSNMKLRSTCREKLIVSLTQMYDMIMRDFHKFLEGFEKYVNWPRWEAIAMRLVTL